MKVAALILAHKNEEQLKRLISVLQHPSIDIYIHLDAKSSLEASSFVQKNVFFTQRRIDISLFDFSMVDAEMELLCTAAANEKYGYYILLSGQDYPLWHIDNIYDYLCKKYPEPLIEVISTDIVTMFAHQFRYPYVMKKFRTRSEAFLKKHLSTRSIYPYKYIPEGIALAVSMMKSLFVKSPKKRLNAMGIMPYFGSQWWILPDVAVDEICKIYEDEKFCDCIKDCFSCDETFFQTAIMIHAERFGISLCDEGKYKGYYPQKHWFVIFSHNHPIILKQEHFGKLITSNKLFARKFDITTDAVILDMIDEHNLQLRNQEITEKIGNEHN